MVLLASAACLALCVLQCFACLCGLLSALCAAWCCLPLWFASLPVFCVRLLTFMACLVSRVLCLAACLCGLFGALCAAWCCCFVGFLALLTSLLCLLCCTTEEYSQRQPPTLTRNKNAHPNCIMDYKTRGGHNAFSCRNIANNTCNLETTDPTLGGNKANNKK